MEFSELRVTWKSELRLPSLKVRTHLTDSNGFGKQTSTLILKDSIQKYPHNVIEKNSSRQPRMFHQNHFLYEKNNNLTSKKSRNLPTSWTQILVHRFTAANFTEWA